MKKISTLKFLLIVFSIFLFIGYEINLSSANEDSNSNLDLTGSVSWNTSESNIAGVWNPETKSAEWNTSESNIAGVFIPNNPDDYWRYLQSIGLF
jgi:hypothetical protein